MLYSISAKSVPLDAMTFYTVYLFVIYIHLPVNTDVPLGQAVWVGSSSGPTATESQNKVRISPVQETQFYKNWLPQRLGNRIV